VAIRYYQTLHSTYTALLNHEEKTMTDTPMAVDINCETGVITERPLTAEEIAQREADAAAYAARQAEEERAATAKAAAKASAEAKLAALGLTADEIAAL
jgi:hypothetical protein